MARRGVNRQPIWIMALLPGDFSVAANRRTFINSL
jgi:hypothetical protein